MWESASRTTTAPLVCTGVLRRRTRRGLDINPTVTDLLSTGQTVVILIAPELRKNIT